MRQHNLSARIILVAAAAVGLTACGHPEQKVVDQYFNAVNQGDDQTLGSFAAVKFDKKVQKWAITDPGAEQRQPAELPSLVKKAADLDAAIADNKKTYNTYFLDHAKEVDQVRDLMKKDAPIPPSLKRFGDDWKGFIEKERDLKRQLADAKAAVEKEKRAVSLSVGQMDEVESLTGDVLTKTVGVDLTVEGAAKPYAMLLRRYEMQGTTGAKLPSRWVVAAIDPK